MLGAPFHIYRARIRTPRPYLSHGDRLRELGSLYLYQFLDTRALSSILHLSYSR